MKKLADRPLMPDPPKHQRPPPQHAGDMPKTCGNCQHFEGDRRLTKNRYPCHNGISGRLETRAIDGCAFGFYPSVERFPLKAGPGGIR